MSIQIIQIRMERFTRQQETTFHRMGGLLVAGPPCFFGCARGLIYLIISYHYLILNNPKHVSWFLRSFLFLIFVGASRFSVSCGFLVLEVTVFAGEGCSSLVDGGGVSQTSAVHADDNGILFWKKTMDVHLVVEEFHCLSTLLKNSLVVCFPLTVRC